MSAPKCLSFGHDRFGNIFDSSFFVFVYTKEALCDASAKQGRLAQMFRDQRRIKIC